MKVRLPVHLPSSRRPKLTTGETGMPHSFCDEEEQDLVAWVEKVLPAQQEA